MAGKTPRLGLNYLNASQEEPEVPLNENVDILDEAFGSVWVEGLGDSPGERMATKLIFANSAVEPQTDGSVLITSEGGGSGGGGGSPVDVTDGTTTVFDVTAIRFTNGASVSEASAGVVDVYIDPVSGNSGSGAAARVKQTVAQTFSAATLTALSWASADFDTASLFDGSHPTRLTAPAPGVYLCAGNIFFASGGEGYATFRVNGTTAIGACTATPGSFGSINFSAMLDLAPGDYVELMFYSTSGTTITITDSNLGQTTNFQMAKLP